MKSKATSRIKSRTIGTSPRTAAVSNPPERTGFRKFDAASTQPLRGGVSLKDFMREVEADADLAPRLANSRRELAFKVEPALVFRRLRLAAGLSQEKLAAAAKTTQTYIARIEAGTVDPGTDMLARLAAALVTDEVTVFTAVRAQRAAKGSKRS